MTAGRPAAVAGNWKQSDGIGGGNDARNEPSDAAEVEGNAAAVAGRADDPAVGHRVEWI